jgi:hypothetical protein
LLIVPLDQPNTISTYFYPFGTYDSQTSYFQNYSPRLGNQLNQYFVCHFLDQEPYYENTKQYLLTRYNRTILGNPMTDSGLTKLQIKILATSEYSDIVDQDTQKERFYKWYYFYHGFAALSWYRDFKYFESTQVNHFDKVFICFNHLVTNYRSYRLHLVSNLIEKNLLPYGLVSLPLQDSDGTWQQEIENNNSLLDTRAKATIHQALKNIKDPLIIDTDTPDGTLSAGIDIDLLSSALFHIVTETVYFHLKLHLTEKIFKPIVAQRPFVLVAAPGNLAYLKSYGFRTFDHWIDESYDTEPDHYIRIEKITAEIARLCAMKPANLIKMHEEMKSVLRYNYNHFYGNFKNIIIDELVDNFGNILDSLAIPHSHLPDVKKQLKQ